ncbi:NucA/NucB deoxyribonuclease domain-containing protein [Pseudanabaena catenata]
MFTMTEAVLDTVLIGILAGLLVLDAYYKLRGETSPEVSSPNNFIDPPPPPPSLNRIPLIVAIALFASTALHSDEAENVGLPTVIWGLEYGQTTVHNYKALHGEGNTSDRYKGSAIQAIKPVFTKKDKRWNTWYENLLPCSNGTKGDKMTCDEFPYSSTYEGGRTNYDQGRVSLALVPEHEQRGSGQGTGLKTFYRLAEINPQDKYGVWTNYRSYDSYYFTRNREVNLLPSFDHYRSTGYTKGDFETAYGKLNP